MSLRASTVYERGNPVGNENAIIQGKLENHGIATSVVSLLPRNDISKV